jgi:Tol biopolymer transport system component
MKPHGGNTRIWEGKIGEKKTQALTGPPFKTFPAASPDSTKIAYVGFKESVKYIEIGDGSEGRNSRLFNYKVERGLFPAWNAVQTQVLYIDPQDALKVMSANNKADAASFSRDRLHSRLWKTEKGEFFTLEKKETGDLWEVYTMDPQGGGQRQIFESAASEIMPPMWSSDSKRIAFIERTGERYSVYTVGRNGEWPRRVFATHDPIRSLSWCPDGQRLAWFCDREGGKRQEIWVAEKESLNPELNYESEGQLESLSWSPEGEHIAFEEKWAFKIGGLRVVRPDLFSTNVLDIKDHKARSLTAGGLFARMPAFSPQGVMLAFITEQRSFPGLPGNWSLKPAARRPASLAVAQLY